MVFPGLTAATEEGRSLNRRFPWWAGYLAAVVLETTVTALLLIVYRYLPLGGYPVYYFLTIMLVAYYLGAGPAVLAFFLGLTAYDYFFIPPLGTLLPHAETAAGWAGIVAYIVGTTVVGTATVMIRRSKLRAERIAEQLRSQEEILHTFIEHTPAAVAMFDRDMRYLAVSREWLAQYNLGDRNIVGLSHYEVFPEIPERWKEIHQRALAGATERCEEDPFPRADGTLDWVKWEIVPWCRSDGSIGGIIMFTEVITERKQTEEALRAQRLLLETVINNIPAQINLMRGSDLRIELINPAYQAIAPGKEMVGKTLDEVWPELDRNFTALCRRVLETGETYEAVDDPVDISRYPGGPTERRYFTWSLIAVDLPGGEGRGILNMSVETTERNRAEEALRESERRYRELVETANSAIIRWKSDGTITFFNQFAQRFFGYSQDEVIGKPVSILVPQTESTGADLTGLVRDILAHPEQYINNINENVRKNGSRVWMTWSNKAVVDEHGEVVEVLAIGSDITDRKRAEEALEKALRDIEERAHELQEANEQLAAANEELAVTNAELEAKTEELRKEAEERKRADDALREEQEHKLDFYRRTIEAATNGKLIVTDRPEIEKIAGPVLANWEIRSRDDIQVARHGIEDCACALGMNEERVGKLIVAAGEAITNAIKHAPNGAASLHRTDDSLIVLVSDRGSGIPAIALPEVALRPGYTTTGTLGMGYKMMIQFADKVYLATGTEGTTVGIVMKLK